MKYQWHYIDDHFVNDLIQFVVQLQLMNWTLRFVPIVDQNPKQMDLFRHNQPLDEKKNNIIVAKMSCKESWFFKNAYIRAFFAAKLNSTSHMQPLTIGKFECWECGCEEFFYQVINVWLWPTFFGRSNSSQKCWHHLKWPNKVWICSY